MRKTTSAVLALCALAALAGRADEAEPVPAGAKAELKKLKGTWAVTKRVLGGREAKAPAGLIYTFDGDKLTRRFAAPAGKAGGRQQLTVTIDTAKKPHRLTMKAVGGKSTVYIYKIEKGELFLATGRGKGAKVPAEFKGDDVALMVLKKEEKAKEKGKE
jgi:uncharacterized protein (TIGR03067 family)